MGITEAVKLHASARSYSPEADKRPKPVTATEDVAKVVETSAAPSFEEEVIAYCAGNSCFMHARNAAVSSLVRAFGSSSV
ncbi:MAG TPA: hypothetical protein VK762_12025 [Polyangiaceae bacterium]|nr:hypothetical protein [Polyangiaceae bacterium]